MGDAVSDESLTAEEFLKSVEKHELTILRDDGVYRHIRLKAPKTFNQFFDLVTWPGSLCFTGDMGTFVFSRIEDMFAFFRRDANAEHRGPLPINRPYWAEKVQAEDPGRVRVWSKTRFQENVAAHLDDCEASPELREAVEDEVLSRIDDGQHVAEQALYEFEHEKFHFQDFFERSSMEFSYRYTWCCFALVWAIDRYDAAKSTQDTTAHIQESVT